jgi:membrane protein YqaA with SNARE-associated domain
MKIPGLHRLYNWTMRHAHGPNARQALFWVSFAESSFFPLPPDVMLVPMVLADRRKAFYLAALCTLASVLGGLLGYAIGYFLYETVGLWIMSLYGGLEKVDEFRTMYAEYGAWIILIKGLTPIPYKIVTIASGLAGYSLFWFIVLSTITRAARFFLVAALLYRFGEPIREFIEKRLELVTSALLVVIVLGFVGAKYLL